VEVEGEAVEGEDISHCLDVDAVEEAVAEVEGMGILERRLGAKIVEDIGIEVKEEYSLRRLDADVVVFLWERVNGLSEGTTAWERVNGLLDDTSGCFEVCLEWSLLW